MKKLFLLFTTIFAFWVGGVNGQQQTWIDYPQAWTVFTLAQQGEYLWIGTNGGAVRMDLSTQATDFFNKSNSRLPSNAVHRIFATDQGSVYFGTECEGVTKYYDTEWDSITADCGTEETNSVNALYVSNDNIWVGYQDGGLWHYDGTSWTGYTTWNSDMPSNTVFDIVRDNDGAMWVGTGGGIVKIDNGTWTVYSPANSDFPSYYVYDIELDLEGNLWFATPDKGLIKLNKAQSTWTVFNISNSGLTTTKIFAVETSSSGKHWIATDRGLFLYANSTWTQFTVDNSPLPNDVVYSLLETAGGKLWIGTLNGLAMYDGASWHTDYQLSNSPISGEIFAILTSRPHTAWIGTRSGFYKYDGEEVVRFDALRHHVTAMAFGKNNKDILIGTQQQGVYIYANGTIDSLKDPLITPYSISALAQDRYGTIWIATEYNGLVTYRNGSYQKFSASDSTFPSNDILSLLADGDYIWIGTMKGLARYDLQHNLWSVFTPDNSGLPGYGVRKLMKDKDGTLWALVPSFWNGSSWDVGGLAKFVGSDWQAISRNVSGLDRKGLNSFYIANDNTIWIGTDDGLVKFVSENNYVEYNVRNSPIPTSSVGAVAVDSLNNVWFSTSSGYPGATQNDLCIFNEHGVVLKVESERKEDLIASGYSLSQNYPNPFGSKIGTSTRISYSIPQAGFVTLKVYDVLGRQVAELVNSFKHPGVYSLQFNALNLPSGVYFYRLKAGNVTLTKKMIFLK